MSIAWNTMSCADLCSKIDFSFPTTHAPGAVMKCMVNLSYAPKGVLGRDSLILQTPPMITPFGASNKYSEKYKMKLNFTEQPLVGQFKALLERIDSTVVDHVFHNQTSILGVTGKSREIIADKYHGLVRHHQKYGASLQIEMIQRGVEFPPAHSRVVAIIKFDSIWVLAGGNSFGVSPICVQFEFEEAESIGSALAIVPMQE